MYYFNFNSKIRDNFNSKVRDNTNCNKKIGISCNLSYNFKLVHFQYI
jgi:hypothetical protein